MLPRAPTSSQALFPRRFGLKALPGRVFRVSKTSVEGFQVFLHLEILQEAWWAQHMRVTVNEFLIQLTGCPEHLDVAG